MLGALLADKTRRSVKFDRSEKSTRVHAYQQDRGCTTAVESFSSFVRTTHGCNCPGLIVVLRSMSLQHFSYLSRQCRMVRADHRKMIPDHRNDLQSPGE